MLVDYWIVISPTNNDADIDAGGSPTDEDKVEIPADSTIVDIRATAFDASNTGQPSQMTAADAVAVKLRTQDRPLTAGSTSGAADYVPLSLVGGDAKQPALVGLDVNRGTLIYHQWRNDFAAGQPSCRGRVVLGMRRRR